MINLSQLFPLLVLNNFSEQEQIYLSMVFNTSALQQTETMALIRETCGGR